MHPSTAVESIPDEVPVMSELPQVLVGLLSASNGYSGYTDNVADALFAIVTAINHHTEAVRELADATRNAGR